MPDFPAPGQRRRVGWRGVPAGGCCALQFTSGVSGLYIHAELRNHFAYVVAVVLSII